MQVFDVGEHLDENLAAGVGRLHLDAVVVAFALRE